MSTLNKFKRTSVAGQFRNVDLPGGTDNASGYFQRDLEVGGDIHLGTETLVDEIYTNTGGNICFNISGTAYQIPPVLLTQLIGLAATLSQKSDISYVDDKIAQLVDSSPTTLDTLNELAAALGDDPNFATTVSTNIGLKADTSVVNTQLLLKADQTYTDNQLLLKADKNDTVLTGLSVIPTPITHTIYCDGQIYFHGGDLANPASRIHIGSNQLMVWDNKINEQIVFRWGPTDSVKQIFHMNGDVTIPGNILNCTTINDINSSIAVKADTSVVNNQLNLKANNTDVNNALANKLSNNVNSSTSAYLHFGLNAQPYTEYLNNTKFGSIGVNKYTNGQAEMNFIQNGFIPGPTNRAFNFLLATSNTTFDELIRINKNGDTTFLGTIASPTIATINTNINLKSNLTYVDSKLLLKDDITSVDSKLLLKDDITSVDSKLLLKDDITSVDSKIANLQNQINAIDPSSDISGTNVSFNNITATGNVSISGVIVNADLSAQLALKADTSAVTSGLALKADTTALTSGLALKADTSTVTSGLALKADKSYTDSQLLNKLYNNENSRMSAYLHFGLNAQPYTEYLNTTKFASISVNKYTNGDAEMNFIQNGYIPGASKRAFNFLLATSNTTFDELIRVNKNGDTTFLGTIASPTINTINTTLGVKADTSALTSGLALKADKNNAVLTGTADIANSNVSTINCNNQIYFYKTNVATPSSRIHIGTIDAMYWDNVLNNQIIYRWGATNIVKQILYPNGNVSIPGDILNCPTITNINTSIGLKADKTYTDAQLLLKADKTYTDAQLATKLSNNANSAIGAYLHFTNHSKPYTEHGTQNFGSISVNKFPSGHGSFDFIHNGFGLSNPVTNAFNFSIATSNTTFDSLLRITKNGNAFFTGNISSPTITTINSNITATNAAVDLKADKSYVDSQLTLYPKLDSAPTFTGNVKSQLYTTNMVRNNSNATNTYTTTTLPGTIVHDGPIGIYVIPTMPLGTRFSVLRTTHGTMTITCADATTYFFNKKDSYYYDPGSSMESYTNSMNMSEDSRTFVMCEMYRSGAPVRVWLTESSHTYSFMHDTFNAAVGAYMLDGGDYGRSNAIWHPILCSNKNLGPANSDDGYVLNPGYEIIVYTDVNYGGGWYKHSNLYIGTPTKPKHFVATSLNNVQSIKLYYNGKEIVVDGISN